MNRIYFLSLFSLLLLGRLFLNKGNWNGQQIISEASVNQSITPDEENGGDGFYENQWWLKEDGAYAAEETFGQYIHVNPKQNMIIVRLGKNYGKTSNWNKIFSLIASKGFGQ